MEYGDNEYTYTVNGDILTKTDTQGTPEPGDDELTTYEHDALPGGKSNRDIWHEKWVVKDQLTARPSATILSPFYSK